MNIAVIGAGVCGLTTGIRLLERGHRVTICAAARGMEITSGRAGAVFTPFRAVGDARIQRWTAESYRVLCDLARREPSASGVQIIDAREYVRFAPQGPPWWSTLVDGFEARPAPQPYQALFATRLPRMSMLRYLPWLESWFERLGGRIVERSLRDAKALFGRDVAPGLPGVTRFVVNCGGVGARELAPDPRVVPVRGQVLHIANDLGFCAALCDQGFDQAAYVFPFDDYVVVGGTYEPGVWEARTTPEAIADVVARCTMLLRADGDPRAGRLADACATPLRAIAGLRPGRVLGESYEDVRLELERLPEGAILHNYGHGRAGVTLSWGSAQDAAAIVEEA